ncbi:hypothetical protein PaeBR_11725 [Paenibacillus sp. BR2-3]|uniref:hypothetical protein n=1 Tax=Paenibacillus sp. BR2-3 TaxID=3048494 RepID=UPI0039773200
MSWEPVGFIFFSTIEGVAVFSLMMSIYRMKATEFIWYALFVILLMNLQSFVLREELSLAFLVPIINMLLFIFLLTTVMRISLVWSSIITISGYFAFVVIQSLTFKILFWNLTLAEVQGDVVKGYMLQSTSGLFGILLAWLLYKFGVGFAADFEKLRFKFEHVMVIGSIIMTLIMAAVFFFYNDIWLNVSYFTVAVLFFLYYALRKEKWND